MSTNKDRIVVYSEPITKRKIEIIAEKDNRKASNYIDVLLVKHIEKYEQEHGKIKLDE